ncbi:MAG: penicillin-binding protein 1C [Bacteroidota bacterium]
MLEHIKKYKFYWLAASIFLLFLYYFSLPKILFNDPTSIVLEDQNGRLLGARIAADGQWRFPQNDSLPNKFIAAITEFEDRRFFSHWGIDPIGIGRAIQQNIKAKSVVSGGSTISMQVIRMARKREKRSLWNKLIEMVLATRLELRCTKAEILQLYATHAPFGGNVVGLETASWRYYKKSPFLLSWSEVATLAVLPNSPALMHPGRNRTALLEKRNRLLQRLYEQQRLDSISYKLALEEPLPDKPLPLPQIAPHLLDRVSSMEQKKDKSRFRSTLNTNLQERSENVLQVHHNRLINNYIYNAAAIVADVETGKILAYIGNVVGAGEEHGEQVDVIPAPRSTGSVIKPLLYASMLEEGKIAPQSLVPDVPTHLSGYRPENFHEQYDGVVTAKRALVRSLNVPIVRMLQEYGLEKFHFQLQQLGFQHINQLPQHYGLPLVLGGAEISLEEITSVYASMARTLNAFPNQDGKYSRDDFRALHYLQEEEEKKEVTKLQNEPTHFSVSSIWQTFDAMRAVERPNSVGEWESFASSRKIAWKTGTSFGFRDAWAVGVNSHYAVGVWVGNADGEGRPGLVGVKTAAPILFDLFKLLPADNDWFSVPYDEMKEIVVCKQSGYRPLDICKRDTVWLSKSAVKMKACPYHQMLHLDKTQTWQVNSDCVAPSEMIHQPSFILPPIEEFYYKSKNPSYQAAPPLRTDCEALEEIADMQLIYPKYHAKIFVPIDLDGELSSTVFKVAHRSADTKIHWHLDRTYLGTTQHFHEMELQPEAGRHLLTLVDEKGGRLERSFEILSKDKSE